MHALALLLCAGDGAVLEEYRVAASLRSLFASCFWQKSRDDDDVRTNMANANELPRPMTHWRCTNIWWPLWPLSSWRALTGTQVLAG